MKRPLVSIIVVNWNGGKIFESCLESLSKLKYPNWELILVDNGSRDGSEKLPKKFKTAIPNFSLIKNKKNVGFAPANNRGYEISKGEYILLLNNDTKVSSNLLSKLVDRIESDRNIGVIQPKIYMDRKPGYLDNAGSFMTRIGFLEHWGFGEKDSKEFDSEREVFSAKGACMLIHRDVIETVGLFDSKFVSYFEESDFCWRVWLAGWKVLYYPSVSIKHRVGFTIRRLDVAQINYDYYKNRINSLIKNFGTVNLLTVVPIHLFASAAIACLFLFKGQAKNTKMIIRAIIYNIDNLGDTLKSRDQVQALRKKSDEELFGPLMHRIDWIKFFGDFRRVSEDIKRKSGEDD